MACKQQGYAELKVMLLCDIAQACQAVHAQGVKQRRACVHQKALPVSLRGVLHMHSRTRNSRTKQHRPRLHRRALCMMLVGTDACMPFTTPPPSFLQGQKQLVRMHEPPAVHVERATQQPLAADRRTAASPLPPAAAHAQEADSSPPPSPRLRAARDDTPPTQMQPSAAWRHESLLAVAADVGGGGAAAASPPPPVSAPSVDANQQGEDAAAAGAPAASLAAAGAQRVGVGAVRCLFSSSSQPDAPPPPPPPPPPPSPPPPPPPQQQQQQQQQQLQQQQQFLLSNIRREGGGAEGNDDTPSSGDEGDVWRAMGSDGADAWEREQEEVADTDSGYGCYSPVNADQHKRHDQQQWWRLLEQQHKQQYGCTTASTVNNSSNCSPVNSSPLMTSPAKALRGSRTSHPDLSKGGSSFVAAAGADQHSTHSSSALGVESWGQLQGIVEGLVVRVEETEAELAAERCVLVGVGWLAVGGHAHLVATDQSLLCPDTMGPTQAQPPKP